MVVRPALPPTCAVIVAPVPAVVVISTVGEELSKLLPGSVTTTLVITPVSSVVIEPAPLAPAVFTMLIVSVLA